MKRFWIILLLLLASRAIVFSETSALWGNLQPGTYGVGFTTRFEYDYSRTFRPKLSYEGVRQTGERARPVQIAIWYPAQNRSGHPMLFQEYVHLIAQELSFETLTDSGKQTAIESFVNEKVAQTQAAERAVRSLLTMTTAAVRDTAAAEGSFPLIIFAPGASGTSFSDSILCEFLASHGYIVAAMPSMGAYDRAATIDLVGFYAYMQDIEFTIGAMHRFPHVDPDHLGIVGFSMGGSAATLVQMRNTDIDAAVYLDTGIVFDIVETWFRPSQYYNKLDLRAPQLFLTREDAEGVNRSAVDGIPFADVYSVWFKSGFQHRHFISDGMFRSIVPGYEPEDRGESPQDLAQSVAGYTLHFFNAFVKKQPPDSLFLKNTPEQNGVPKGLMTLEYKKAKKAPPREPEFVNIIRNEGIEKGRAIFLELKQANPSLDIFRETTLNSLGYEYLFRGQADSAVAIFSLNVDGYPKSANAYDSLSEALEAAGKKEAAIENAEKALSLLSQDKTMEERRRVAIKQSAEGRLSRLRS